MNMSIELPCYVGNSIYVLSDSGIEEHEITAISINVGKNKQPKMRFYYETSLGTASFNLNDLGKTVFRKRPNQ